MARYDLIGAAVPSLLRFRENETDGLALTADKYSTAAISTTEEPSHVNKLSSLVGLIVIGISLILVIVCTTTLRRLHAFKGPKWAAISNWWYFRQLIGGSQHIAFHRISQSYGIFGNSHTRKRAQS